MNNLNSVLIEGNLTQDPELKTVPSGKNTCRFPIATNRYYRNAERELVQETTFITVDTWGTLAENCSKYLHKGRGVRVVGRLRQDRWQDDQENTRERFIIVAEHVEFQRDPAWNSDEQKKDTMNSQSEDATEEA
jgi:single-strand DNA-binding protein